jgi:hypothetical protein
MQRFYERLAEILIWLCVLALLAGAASWVWRAFQDRPKVLVNHDPNKLVIYYTSESGTPDGASTYWRPECLDDNNKVVACYRLPKNAKVRVLATTDRQVSGPDDDDDDDARISAPSSWPTSSRTTVS